MDDIFNTLNSIDTTNTSHVENLTTEQQTSYISATLQYEDTHEHKSLIGEKFRDTPISHDKHANPENTVSKQDITDLGHNQVIVGATTFKVITRPNKWSDKKHLDISSNPPHYRYIYSFQERYIKRCSTYGDIHETVKESFSRMFKLFEQKHPIQSQRYMKSIFRAVRNNPNDTFVFCDYIENLSVKQITPTHTTIYIFRGHDDIDFAYKCSMTEKSVLTTITTPYGRHTWGGEIANIVPDPPKKETYTCALDNGQETELTAEEFDKWVKC
jgi:hypothetical protein